MEKIKERKISKDGISIEDITYKNEKVYIHIKYNNEGKIVERTSYSPREFEVQMLYEYDARGNLSRLKQTKKNEVLHDRKLLYDERNNLIEDEDIFKEEYKFLNTDLKWNDINNTGYKHKYFYN